MTDVKVQEAVRNFLVAVRDGDLDPYLAEIGSAVHRRWTTLQDANVANQNRAAAQNILPAPRRKVDPAAYATGDMIQYGDDHYLRQHFIGLRFVVTGDYNNWCRKHAGQTVLITGARSKFMVTINPDTPEAEERQFFSFGQFPFLFEGTA